MIERRISALESKIEAGIARLYFCDLTKPRSNCHFPSQERASKSRTSALVRCVRVSAGFIMHPAR